MLVRTEADIAQAIIEHREWWQDNAGDLSDNRRFVAAKHANLQGIDLWGQQLRQIELSHSNCDKARFSRVWFGCGKLRHTSLVGADFYRADIQDVDFSYSNCSNAEFRLSGLAGAKFKFANLQGTCLDPKAAIPAITDERLIAYDLELRVVDGLEYVYGWRTQTSASVGAAKYRTGRSYTAPVFSVCPFTPCHPGIYMAGLPQMRQEYSLRKIWRCRCLRSDLHHAAGKFRCRRLEILPKSEQPDWGL